MTTKKRMLVDASHPEETRIVVTNGNKLDEFDFESATRRQLRGNIYLAKVTRVEPSLQAAFVEYGGNRHGFLAFSEIHPDYYQIPVADREALLRAEAEAVRQQAKADEANEPDEDATETAVDANVEVAGEETANTDDTEAASDEDTTETDADSLDSSGTDISSDGDGDEVTDSRGNNVDDLGGGEGEDLLETRKKQPKRYKIQEVIKRRQVILVQVVKEERGNKGAALTTYLSLAGRYSVLMPNTARGGGISRKITSGADRKRLKQIASELSVPAGMGVILRTAGASRTKAEIRRDFEYLSRLWENVRQLTLKSSAPSLVYEEGSLIKRTIRDLYNKEISEVLVAGDDAYREAKDFMQLIMPSHAKNVKAHKESQHIFSRYNVESQLDSMFSPQVTLPSGGYIVINPTEALVSIDVNSGRATKEHNIEATALQTNLEAAEEAARQFRLRDLAGLIVIDFIDMNERRSIRAIEKRLKDALKNDRARIQVGRISHFGLLEMSRQRMRSGILESSTNACPVCEGTGIIRAVESRALMVFRAIEDHVVRKPNQSIEVKAPTEVALYLLNSKRGSLIDLETRFNLSITVSADNLKNASEYTIGRGDDRSDPSQSTSPAIKAQALPPVQNETNDESDDENRPQRKRRRRKSSNVQQTNAHQANEENTNVSAEASEAGSENTPKTAPTPDGEQDEQPRKRRRRGRRGGRRNRNNAGSETENMTGTDQASAESGSDNQNQTSGDQEPNSSSATNSSQPVAEQNSANTEQSAQSPSETVQVDNAGEKEDKKPAKRRPRKKKTDDAKSGKPKSSKAEKGDKAAKNNKAKDTKSDTNSEVKPASTAPQEAPIEAPADKPKRDLPDEGVIVSTSNSESKETPKKKGWWARW